ncbi:MAG TPA: hypothetical protein VJV05_10860, partial [Pyrinomonadaceae bacterium]|nr:hypothetical protein [Pyrinomonadaceae bacterium]
NDMGGIQKELRERVYESDAVGPAFTWIKSSPPKSPKVKLTRDSQQVRATWTPRGKRAAFWFVVYVKDKAGWSYSVLPAAETSIWFSSERQVEKVVVSAVDRLGNESR